MICSNTIKRRNQSLIKQTEREREIKRVVNRLYNKPGELN